MRSVRIAVPRESAAGERRVALVPDAVAKLAAAGFEVALERGAGLEAGFTDEAYARANIRKLLECLRRVLSENAVYRRRGDA